MKYLTTTLGKLPVTIQADGETIKVLLPEEQAILSLKNGELIIVFADILPPEPPPPPKEKGIKRHILKKNRDELAREPERKDVEPAELDR